MAGQLTVRMKSILEFLPYGRPREEWDKPRPQNPIGSVPLKSHSNHFYGPADFDRVRSQLHPRSRVQNHVHERHFRVDS